MTNGFGDVDNRDVYWLEEFQGQLYAGTLRTPAPNKGAAQVWRSPDGSNYTQLTNFSPQFAGPPPAVAVFGMVDDGTRLFIGFAGPPTSTLKISPLYETSDGTTFTQANSGSGFVQGTNTAALPSPVIFGGKIYFATRNESGTEVWRRDVAGGSWAQVLTPGAVDGKVQKMTTWMWVFNGQIYAATSGGCGCGSSTQGDIGRAHLFRSSTGNSGEWTDVLAGNAGFGDANDAIASMAELGGFLYAGTTNREDGGQLWRSADGTSWQNVVGPAGTQPSGFGNKTKSELHELRTIGGRLWITTARPEGEAPGSPLTPPPPEIWRTADGITFVRSNDPGFDGSVTGGYPMLEGFGGTVYAGARGPSGGQIWKLTAIGPDPAPPSDPEPPDGGTQPPTGGTEDPSGGEDVEAPPARTCSVPKLAGKTLSAAKTKLKNARCRLGTVTRKQSRTVKKDRVISQSPKAGKTKPAGTKVNLVLSSGKKQR